MVHAVRATCVGCCGLAGAVAAAVWPAAALAGECGAPGMPCRVADGEYLAVAPELHEGDPPRGGVLFLHGAGRSGEDVAADPDLATAIVARGYVLLAPSGLPREGREGRFWSLGTRPPFRDEAAFLDQVLADAVPRFRLDRSRVLVAGFSLGAGLVWQLACHESEAFAAFAPVAGAFWRGQPANCAGPVRILLTHGWRDDAVPLEGEDHGHGVESAAFDGADLWRRVNGCADPHAATYAEVGPFWQRSWTDCAAGSALTFVLDPDGHEVPAGWADMALDWFETVVPRG
ncbi:MAG: PHB depolymerase family esterase [Geminicoccaceae bacterium]